MSLHQYTTYHASGTCDAQYARHRPLQATNLDLFSAVTGAQCAAARLGPGVCLIDSVKKKSSGQSWRETTPNCNYSSSTMT